MSYSSLVIITMYALKNKNFDKNVNVQHTQQSQVLNNKFVVLDEEDSDTENSQHKLHTENVQGNDGFVEVKRNKKSKFDQPNQTQLVQSKQPYQKNGYKKEDNLKRDNTNFSFGNSGTKRYENTYSSKFESKYENRFDNKVDNKLENSDKTGGKFGTVLLENSNDNENHNKSEKELVIAPLQIVGGVSKFSKSEGVKNNTLSQDDEWETQIIKKVRNRRDENDSKQLYDETGEDNQNDQASLVDQTCSDKQLYVETRLSAQDMGNNMFLHCFWTVWTHKEDCADWTEKSYTSVYEIDSIGKFWRFFNNFHLFDKKENQFFIMRKKIKPIWEDNENRKGGICSIKFDSFSRPGKIDVGTEMMISVCLLIMNETFLLNNSEINGISYANKNRSVLIKIWSKNYTTDMPNEIPTSLMIKFDTVLRNMDRSHFGKKTENKISIQYKPIKPEDNMA